MSLISFLSFGIFVYSNLLSVNDLNNDYIAEKLLYSITTDMLVSNPENLCLTADIPILFQYLISDAIVVWRAWILYTGNHRMQFLLILSLCGTFGNLNLTS